MVNSMNAPVNIPLEGETDPLQLAMKELKAGFVPLVIRRCASRYGNASEEFDDV